MPSTPRTNGNGETDGTITPLDLNTARRLGRFALELASDALSPRYHKGDILIVDTDAQPMPGDGIIIEDHTTRAHVAFLLDDDAGAYNHAGQRLRRGTFTILGAVVQILPTTS